MVPDPSASPLEGSEAARKRRQNHERQGDQSPARGSAGPGAPHDAREGGRLAGDWREAAHRLCGAYKRDGAAGLVSRERGRVGNRKASLPSRPRSWSSRAGSIRRWVPRSCETSWPSGMESNSPKRQSAKFSPKPAFGLLHELMIRTPIPDEGEELQGHLPIPWAASPYGAGDGGGRRPARALSLQARLFGESSILGEHGCNSVILSGRCQS